MYERPHPLLMTCGMIMFATALVCLGVSLHFFLDYLAGGRNPYPRTQVFTVPASAPVGQPAPQEPPPATATPIQDPKAGDVVTVGNWQYQVTHLDRQKTVVWSAFDNKTDAKGVWQIVHVKMMNVGKQTYPINDWDFKLYDSKGIIYTADSTSSEYSQFHKLSATGDNYPPNVPAEIGLLFDVDPNAAGLRLYLVQAKTFIRLEQ